MSKFKIVSLCLIVMCFISGCNTDINHDVITNETRFNGDDLVVEYVDEETGVHYLIYKGFRKGGITVMYDADGNIKVDKDGD